MLTQGRTRGLADDDRRNLAAVLGRPRYEVLPLPDVEEEAVRYAGDAVLTVTASSRRGLAPTLDLAARLAGRGLRVVPHLPARMVCDEAELKEILDELSRHGVQEIFVVGGDVDPPVGTFSQSLDLLVAMDRLGYDMTVGVAGYPEAHPKIPDDVTVQAMWDKRHYASYIVSQMCFDPAAILRWVHRVRDRGITLPILLGVPGPVSTRRLLRVSSRIGVRASARFVSRHRGSVLRIARPGPWHPERLLRPLAPHLDDDRAVSGLHLYTFNDLAATERWRQAALGRLQQGGESS